MGWKEAHAAIAEQIARLKKETGENDAAVARGVRAVARGEPLPPPFGGRPELEAPLHRLAWLALVRAPALRRKAHVTSIMALELVEAGSFPLAGLLDELRALEATAEREGAELEEEAPPGSIEATLRKSAAEVDSIAELSGEALEARVRGPLERLRSDPAAHEEAFGDLVAGMMAELAEAAGLPAGGDAEGEGPSAAAFVARGAVRAHAGEAEAALADFDRALEIDPDFVPALVARGNLRVARGDVEAGLEDLDDALDLAPDDGGIYLGRGLALVAYEDPEGAAEDFRAALERLPEDSPLRAVSEEELRKLGA